SADRRPSPLPPQYTPRVANQGAAEGRDGIQEGRSEVERHNAKPQAGASEAAARGDYAAHREQLRREGDGGDRRAPAGEGGDEEAGEGPRGGVQRGADPRP